MLNRESIIYVYFCSLEQLRSGPGRGASLCNCQLPACITSDTETVSAYKFFYHNKTKMSHFKLEVLVQGTVGFGENHYPEVHSM